MMSDLPTPGGRWVSSAKVRLILAVRSGAIMLDDVYRTYSLSPEGFRAWEDAFKRWGQSGLRSTQVQRYGGSGKKPKLAEPVPVPPSAPRVRDPRIPDYSCMERRKSVPPAMLQHPGGVPGQRSHPQKDKGIAKSNRGFIYGSEA